MNLDINDLDLLPAMETTGNGEPQLISSCCGSCYTSLMLASRCD